MILLHITSTRDFMSKLLLKDVFDRFLLSEASVTTYNAFHIDGRLRHDFYAFDEEKKESTAGRDYSLWGEVRPVCRDLIKGRNTPLSFHFILRLPDEDTEKIVTEISPDFSASDVDGLFLNIKFNFDGLFITTGTSLRVFTMDKSLDEAWDSYIKSLLTNNGVSFDEDEHE